MSKKRYTHMQALVPEIKARLAEGKSHREKGSDEKKEWRQRESSLESKGVRQKTRLKETSCENRHVKSIDEK